MKPMNMKICESNILLMKAWNGNLKCNRSQAWEEMW